MAFVSLSFFPCQVSWKPRGLDFIAIIKATILFAIVKPCRLLKRAKKYEPKLFLIGSYL